MIRVLDASQTDSVAGAPDTVVAMGVWAPSFDTSQLVPSAGADSAGGCA
jgi:hypothetical protein